MVGSGLGRSAYQMQIKWVSRSPARALLLIADDGVHGVRTKVSTWCTVDVKSKCGSFRGWRVSGQH
mgnify:CR=1 FL=1